MGKTPERGNKRYWSEATIPWVSISDMLPSQHIDNTKEKITETALKEVFRERFSPKGTLLMSFKLTVGRTSILDLDAVHNEAIISIYPYKCFKQDFQEYLLYFLPIFSSLAQSHDAIKGKTLNSKSIDNILIPLPPENEQKRILIKFKTISITSNYIYDNQEELSKLKDGLKNKILDLAIRGKLVEQDPNDEPASVLLEKIKAEKAELVKQGKIKKDKQESYIYKTPDNRHYGDDKNHYTYFEQIGSEIKDITAEIPFDIPDSWEWVRLNNIGNIVSGGTPKTEIKENWENGTIPWLTPADMKYIKNKYVKHGERFITKQGLNSSSAVLMPENSIVYSSRAPIGYIAITQNTLCTNQGFKSFVSFDNKLVDYIYYTLIALTDNIIARASGTTFKEISGSEFAKTLIPLPPLSEQRKIVSKLENVIQVIEHL